MEAAESRQPSDASVIGTFIATRDCTGISADARIPIRAGLWLREAEEALMGGLNPLDERLRRRGGKLTQWGIWLERGHITVARARSRESPAVIELDEMHPGVDIAAGWDSWTQFQFPMSAFGRWTRAQKHFQPRLNELIRRRTLDTPLDGMLAKERAYYLARFVTHFGARHQNRIINLDELRAKLATWVDRANESEWSTWQGEVDSADVWWLDAYLAHETGNALERPWPVGDQPRGGRFAWESYSKALTRTLAIDILREAIIGYRQLVEINFPRFGSALGLYGMLPLHIDGFLNRAEPGSEAISVRMSLMLHRRPGIERDAAPTIAMTYTGEQTTPSFWDRGAEHYRRAAPTRFDQSPVQSIELPLHASRPATNLAYRWLAADLAALAWLEKGSPYFD